MSDLKSIDGVESIIIADEVMRQIDQLPDDYRWQPHEFGNCQPIPPLGDKFLIGYMVGDDLFGAAVSVIHEDDDKRIWYPETKTMYRIMPIEGSLAGREITRHKVTAWVNVDTNGHILDDFNNLNLHVDEKYSKRKRHGLAALALNTVPMVMKAIGDLNTGVALIHISDRDDGATAWRVSYDPPDDANVMRVTDSVAERSTMQVSESTAKKMLNGGDVAPDPRAPFIDERKIKLYKTFADACRDHGFPFHAETVILNINDVVDYPQSPDDPDLVVEANDRVRPLFDYMFLEYTGEMTKGYAQGVYVVTERLDDFVQMQWLQVGMLGGYLHACPDAGFSTLELSGHLIEDVEALYPTPKPPIEHLRGWGAGLPAYATDMMEIMVHLVFALIHRKRDEVEVEEVKLARGIRRRAKKVLGTEPSNHYSIKIIDLRPIQRRGAHGGKGTTKKVQTIQRRGYFFTQPDSHPLPQFAGKTFYSPPLGGKAKSGQAIYKIRM